MIYSWHAAPARGITITVKGQSRAEHISDARHWPMIQEKIAIDFDDRKRLCFDTASEGERRGYVRHIFKETPRPLCIVRGIPWRGGVAGAARFRLWFTTVTMPYRWYDKRVWLSLTLLFSRSPLAPMVWVRRSPGCYLFIFLHPLYDSRPTLQPPSSRNSNPESHCKRSPPLPATVRACTFIAGRILFPPRLASIFSWTSIIIAVDSAWLDAFKNVVLVAHLGCWSLFFQRRQHRCWENAGSYYGHFMLHAHWPAYTPAWYKRAKRYAEAIYQMFLHISTKEIKIFWNV